MTALEYFPRATKFEDIASKRMARALIDIYRHAYDPDTSDPQEVLDAINRHQDLIEKIIETFSKQFHEEIVISRLIFEIQNYDESL